MEISQDDVYEVFSWLPAKAVCKFKTVCKSFSKFTEEISFKTKQAQNSLAKDDTCFFIQHDNQRFSKVIELHPLPEEKLSSGLSNNIQRFLSKSVSVLASSNGLILCSSISDDPLELFICNPVTKSWSLIPTGELVKRPPYGDLNLVLLDCYHGSSDDYSTFLFEPTLDWSSSYVCRVYQGNEGVWKTMKRDFFVGGRNMQFNMPVFHNGALHFISDCNPYFGRGSPFFRPYIMSYNLDNGISTMIKLPQKAIKGSNDVKVTCKMGIFKWGKVTSSNRSICLVRLRRSVFTVWFLKDYGSRSWQRVLSVRVKALGLKEKDPKVTEFMVMNGDLLVFATEIKVYSCGLMNERYLMVEEICDHGCGFKPQFIPYTDTLRPCGIAATSMPC